MKKNHASFLFLFLCFTFFNISFSATNQTSPDFSNQPKKIEESQIGNMIFVEGGEFQMGCDVYIENGMEFKYESEQPKHKVKVNSFYISKYEVTADDYDKFCKETKTEKPPLLAMLTKGKQPINCIVWQDALKYCNWLSEKEGLSPCYTFASSGISCDFSKNGFRLPTEAEWEFAAKGGKLSKGYIYSGSNNVDEVAWNVNLRKGKGANPIPVGQKLPNELGIYDMSGNVREMCFDWFDKDYYKKLVYDNPKGPEKTGWIVTRGGDFEVYTEACRVTARGNRNIEGMESCNLIGFRIASTNVKKN